MNPSFRREKEENYMILEAPPDYTEDFRTRMLCMNSIPGILGCHIRIFDDIRSFYYEITSMQALSTLFEKRPIGRRELECILLELNQAMEGVMEYLLEVDGICLDPQTIYMDMETGRTMFAYLPFVQGNITQGFGELMEYVLKHLDHRENDTVLWGYELYSRTRMDNYSLGGLLKEVKPPLSQAKEEKPSATEWKAEESPGKEAAGRVAGGKARKKKRKSSILLPVLAFAALGVLVLVGFLLKWSVTEMGGACFLYGGVLIYFWGLIRKRKTGEKEGKEVVLRDTPNVEFQEVEEDSQEEKQEIYGATTLLSSEARLVSTDSRGEETILLREETLYVGKHRDQADIILDQEGISRLHAKVEKRDGGYFVTDLNSTNGTFVDGERLEANQGQRLEDNTRVSFGQVEYLFKR